MLLASSVQIKYVNLVNRYRWSFTFFSSTPTDRDTMQTLMA